MAGLCTGISYGLSQSSNNKEIIFVKLTDSAYRAIEEYQKNHAKLNSHPTIQFSGNEGLLSFPSVANNVGQHFSFSIADIEGPQGSFECLQQCQDQLDILGALTSKMRIHAKDDVYETTRVRMAEAEETQKKKSTREIKPNQPDIGRRCKINNKNPLDRITNIPNSNLITNRRDLSQNNSSSNLLNNNLNSNNNNVNLNNNNNSSSSNQNNSTSNLISNGIGGGNGGGSILSSSSALQSANNNSNINNMSGTTSSTLGNLSSNGLISKSRSTGGSSLNGNLSSVSNGSSPGGLISANNHHTLPMTNGSQMNGLSKNGRGNGQTNGGKNTVDVTKRPLKERLIHLLAIRPYKKPEVYQRLVSEGVRDREKNCISNVLKSVSFLRDNTYHLHRHIWNDVQEDWPFYTEQEKQLLKRRKPQNLTPPLSSDGGSSTSGQSPTSTHNGSPPPPIKRPTLLAGEKNLEGPTAKKPRISHLKKNIIDNPEPVISSRRGVTDSRDSSNMNPRSRENNELMVTSTNYFGSNVTPNAHESEDNGMGLSYSVLNNEAAKRITTTAPTITSNDQDLMRLNANEYDVNEIQSDNEKPGLNGSINEHDFDQFTRITDIEQRRKYKTEFDNDYAEYRKLHAEIEQTSKRFEQLGKKLRSEKHNHQKYKDIQKQILKEYNQKMRDSHHQEAKRRFNYLHQKLSHIKRLVNEYDTALKKNIHIIQPNY